MTGDSDALHIMEVVLTAEIFNQNPNLDINDLTPACREIFSIAHATDTKRPVYVSDGLIKRTLGIIRCTPEDVLKSVSFPTRSSGSDSASRHWNRLPNGSSSREGKR